MRANAEAFHKKVSIRINAFWFEMILQLSRRVQQ